MLRQIAATTLLFALGPVLAQAPQEATDARQIHWQRSLDDALAVAKATGRPLFLAVNMDGESASDRIVHEEYTDPTFVALTRHCVCLGASLFRHNARDHDDQGHRIPCPRFGEITCGEHMALEPVLFEKYLSDGERVAPRHAVVLADGKKAFDLSLCFDLLDIDKALAAAVAPGLPGNPGALPADTGTVPGGDLDLKEEIDLVFTAEGADWATLAARRDSRGRDALEAALDRTRDEASLLAAVEAIGMQGDRGAVDGLRLLFARAAELPQSVSGPLVGYLAAKPELAQACFTAVRGMLQQAGDLPGEAGADLRARALMPWLVELHTGAMAEHRSLLCACAAVGLLHGRLGAMLIGDYVDMEVPVGSAFVAALRDTGGAVDLAALLQTARAITAQQAQLPKTGGPTDAMPEVKELEQQLDKLDAERAEHKNDPEWYAQYAKASLDLGRRRLEAGQRDAQILLEDAALHFEKALAKAPDRYEWWIERARTAYFLMRFQDQVEYGRKAYAIAAAAAQLPGEQELLQSPVLHDARAVEALRWIGDGDARLLAARADQGAKAQLAGMIDGLRALGIVAASPYSTDKDWISLSSFAGAIGLWRQELAIVQCGAMRFPASRDLRQALNAALWNCGRPDLSGPVADAIAEAHAPSADALWFSGYAWILTAEDARRTERPWLASRAYDTAVGRFARAAQQNQDYADSCSYFIAVAFAGQGMAMAQSGDRSSAASCLATALARHADLSQLKDGLGYDALDLVDKILEWRAGGSHPVAPMQLLDQLDKVVADDPYWAVAVSDSALREALRADGRNPVRKDMETVDAAGNKIVMPMGLPTDEGDEWLRASIEAGRRAVQRARTDADKQPLAQSDTIWAERMFERGKLDGVQAALVEAAPLQGLEPPAADADEAALRALAAQLRERLGEARPRQRDGR